MGNDKIIVGMDLSLTSTGLCIFAGGEHKLFMVRTKPDQFATEVERVQWIGRSVQQKIKSFLTFGEALSPEDIFWGVEDYAFNSRTGKVITRAEVTGFIKQIMLSWTGRGPVKVHPKTLKKFICGRANNVSKAHHLSYALEKYKIHFPNDDVCDAYCVGRIVKHLVEQDDDLYVYEQKCLETVSKYADNAVVLKEIGNE